MYNTSKLKKFPNLGFSLYAIVLTILPLLLKIERFFYEKLMYNYKYLVA